MFGPSLTFQGTLWRHPIAPARLHLDFGWINMKFSKLVTLVALVTAPIAHADYWVSVASFQSRDNAEAGLLKAQSRSAETFAVIASETSSGFFYRIAAGPYKSAADAKSPLQYLRDSGYASAWIWQGQSSQGISSVASRRQADESFDFKIEGSKQADDLFSDDDFFNEDLDALFDSDKNDGVSEVVVDLPKELAPAPANYQLNRLQRD